MVDKTTKYGSLVSQVHKGGPGISTFHTDVHTLKSHAIPVFPPLQGNRRNRQWIQVLEIYLLYTLLQTIEKWRGAVVIFIDLSFSSTKAKWSALCYPQSYQIRNLRATVYYYNNNINNFIYSLLLQFLMWTRVRWLQERNASHLEIAKYLGHTELISKNCNIYLFI